MAKTANIRAAYLTRGQLSDLTGCNIETVRYYERIGLMPDPPRSPGGRRQYDQEHLKRLNFICRSRGLGFNLEEVRGLLRLVDGGEYTCDEVRSLTSHHLRDVQDRIEDLKRLEGVLERMISKCEGGTVPDCPIIDVLYDADAS